MFVQRFNGSNRPAMPSIRSACPLLLPREMQDVESIASRNSVKEEEEEEMINRSFFSDHH